MKQEAKGKIFVGMMVSIVAFGFATGAGVFMNTNPLSSVGIMNLTHQSEFPTITTQPSTVPTSQNNKQNTTTSNQNYIPPKTNTNTPVNSGNSTKTPTKSNTTSINSSG